MRLPHSVVEAIRLNPESLDVRIHYAHQLRSHGEVAKADFIEIQCKLTNSTLSSEEVTLLSGQYQTLYNDYGQTWCDELSIPLTSVVYLLGFIDHWSPTVSELLSVGDDVLLSAPISKLTVIVDQSLTSDVFASLRCLTLIRDLTIVVDNNSQKISSAPHVLNSKQWRNIERLALQNIRVTTPVVSSLKHFGSVKHLDLSNSGMSDKALRALIELANLEQLVSLNLASNDISDEGATLLAAKGNLPSLKQVELTNNKQLSADGIVTVLQADLLVVMSSLSFIGDPLELVETIINHPNLLGLESIDASTMATDCVQVIIDCPKLTSLRSLTLRDCLVSDEQVMQLSARPHFSQLEELDLTGNGLSSVGINAFAASTVLQKLTSLNLSQGHCGSAITALTNSDNVRSLRALCLSTCDLQETEAEALAASQTLRSLRLLDLSNNRIRNQGLKALSECSWIQQITELNLGNSCLEKNASEYLTTPAFLGLEKLHLWTINPNDESMDESDYLAICSAKWSNLQLLNLNNTNLDNECLVALANNPSLHTLQKLYINTSRVTSRGIQAIAQSNNLPNLQVIELHEWFADEGSIILANHKLDNRLPALIRVETKNPSIKTVIALARANLLNGINEINVERCGVTDEDLQELAQLPGMMPVKSFVLLDNLITEVGLLALLESPYLSARRIEIDGNRIGIKGLIALATMIGEGNSIDLSEQDLTIDDLQQISVFSPSTQRCSLSLSNCRLGRDGFHALLSNGLHPHYTVLNFFGNHLDADMVLLLANVKGGMSSLNLGNNPIGDRGIEHLVNLPQMVSLETLLLAHCNLTDKALETVAASTRLPRLSTLDVSSNAITARGIQALMDSKCIPNLYSVLTDDTLEFDGVIALLARNCLANKRYLDLGNRGVTDNDIMRLSRTPNLERVEVLVLDNNMITSRGLTYLMAHQPFPYLESLSLNNNPIADRGATAIANAELPQLRRLYLAKTKVTDWGVRAILENPNHVFDELSVLPNSKISLQTILALGERLGSSVISLRSQKLGDNDIFKLATSEALSGVIQLDLYGNRIGHRGSKALCESEYVRSLRNLNLGGNQLDKMALRTLANSPYLISLESLSLDNQYLEHEAVIALCESRYLDTLQELSLEKTRLTDEGVLALWASESLGSIHSLNLANNALTDKSALFIARSERSARLRWLNLGDNRFSRSAIRQLRDSPFLVHTKLTL